MRILMRFKVLPLLLVIAVLLFNGCGGEADSTLPNPLTGSGGLAFVESIIDGDTVDVVIEDVTVRVRLIGVDTPEINNAECYSQEAKTYISSLLADQFVWLEYENGSPTYDKYGRLLAYLYAADYTLVNLALIKEGYGKALTYFAFNLSDQFVLEERFAQANGLGLWSNCQ